MSQLLRLDGVGLEWDGRPILQNIHLQVSAGEIVTLIGPNGAGKSSLVKLACGLMPPTRGQLTRAPGLQVGYVPQRLPLQPQLPISVARFLALTDSPRHQQQACLQQLGITHLAPLLLHQLSGGELQRVLLARALVRKPQLLILDEPAQGVDLTGQMALYRTLAQVRDTLGCGVLMVSHDLHVVMAQTDTVYCLNRHICCQGAPESVSQHPEYIALFGKDLADIAVYTHHHDHTHNLQGDVEPCCEHPHA